MHFYVIIHWQNENKQKGETKEKKFERGKE